MKSLWFAEGRSRCFLVPDAKDLPPGDLEIRTSIGRHKRVRETALEPYEVSREEAAEWSKARLRGILGAERGNQEKGKEQGDLPIFSALSGESAEDLHSDQEALKRGLRQAGAKIDGVFKSAMSASEEDRRQAQEKLEELRAVVAEAEAAKEQDGGHGEAGDGEGEAEAPRQGAEKALRSFADLAGTLGRAAERAGARFGEAADELRAQREAARGGAEGDGPAERGDPGAARGEPGPSEDREE